MLALLTESECFSFARFARDGSLTDANLRFLEVCDAGVAPTDILLPEIVVVGRQEEMLRLLAGGEPDVERRNVHFGTGAAVPVTLRVTWAWDGDELLMLGEPPSATERRPSSCWCSSTAACPSWRGRT